MSPNNCLLNLLYERFCNFSNMFRCLWIRRICQSWNFFETVPRIWLLDSFVKCLESLLPVIVCHENALLTPSQDHWLVECWTFFCRELGHIFFNFGTPPNYLGLKKYTKKSANLRQNNPNWPKYRILYATEQALTTCGALSQRIRPRIIFT